MMDELAEAARRTADGLALDDIRDLLSLLLDELRALRQEVGELHREVKGRRPITSEPYNPWGTEKWPDDKGNWNPPRYTQQKGGSGWKT